MRLLSTLIAALTLSTPLTAQEQVANGSQIGNWQVLCEAVTVNETACRLRQTLTLADSGQLVLNLLAAARDEGGALLVAQVPMGVYLPGGAVFRPQGDDTTQTEMVWQSCGGQICEAAISLTADDIAALSAAEAVTFGYRMSAGADPILMGVDMSALQTALDAIRPAE